MNSGNTAVPAVTPSTDSSLSDDELISLFSTGGILGTREIHKYTTKNKVTKRTQTKKLQQRAELGLNAKIKANKTAATNFHHLINTRSYPYILMQFSKVSQANKISTFHKQRIRPNRKKTKNMLLKEKEEQIKLEKLAEEAVNQAENKQEITTGERQAVVINKGYSFVLQKLRSRLFTEKDALLPYVRFENKNQVVSGLLIYCHDVKMLLMIHLQLPIHGGVIDLMNNSLREAISARSIGTKYNGADTLEFMRRYFAQVISRINVSHLEQQHLWRVAGLSLYRDTPGWKCVEIMQDIYAMRRHVRHKETVLAMKVIKTETSIDNMEWFLTLFKQAEPSLSSVASSLVRFPELPREKSLPIPSSKNHKHTLLQQKKLKKKKTKKQIIALYNHSKYNNPNPKI